MLNEESQGISPSLKRKRSDDETDGVRSEVSETLQTTEDVRPSKRLRSSITTRDIVRGVAAAAGYTSLGAALTWAALAYV